MSKLLRSPTVTIGKTTLWTKKDYGVYGFIFHCNNDNMLKGTKQLYYFDQKRWAKYYLNKWYHNGYGEYLGLGKDKVTLLKNAKEVESWD